MGMPILIPDTSASCSSGPSDSDNASVQQCYDVNARDPMGKVPLHDAALNNQTELITELLRRKADVDAADKAGRTPLHFAIEQGRIEAVQLLLLAGADVNHRSDNRYTALALAQDMANHEMQELIVRHGGVVSPQREGKPRGFHRIS